MVEIESLLNAKLSGILSPATLILAVFFIVPGFVAMKVYDLTVPSERRNFGNSLIEVVSFSLLNTLLWAWLVLLLDVRNFPLEHPVWSYLITVLVTIFSPVVLAVGFRKFLDLELIRRAVGDPYPTGWDAFFGRREPCWILFHLKGETNTVIGGYFGLESSASSHPYKQQIYVEELWRVDSGTFEFLEKVDRTRDAIISAEDCEFVELYKEE